MALLISPLNVILDADASIQAGWTLPDLASACLSGGARFLQLRAKGRPSGWLLDTARDIAERAHAEGGVLIVNDRSDVALLAHADGVHLGQDDLVARSARAILGDGAVIGLSTHTIQQTEMAMLEPVSYVAVGPIFATRTKATGHAPVGLDRVREAAVAARVRGIGVVAIGGITLERVADVVGAGASAVAVIGDLFSTGDPEARVRSYLERLAA